MSRLKQLVRIADEKAHALVSPMRKNSDESALAAYRKAVFEWKHTYVAWIQKNESGCATEYSDKNVNDRLKSYLDEIGWVAYRTSTGYLSADITDYLSEILSDSSSDSSRKVSIVYGDEDYLWEDGSKGMRMCPFFKPDYSSETLLSFSYFGELIFLERTIAEKLSKEISQEADKEIARDSQENLQNNIPVDTINCVSALKIYDISLRASEIAGRRGVGHIKHVAYHRSACRLVGAAVQPSAKVQSDAAVQPSAKVQSDTEVWPGDSAYLEAYSDFEHLVSEYLENDANLAQVLVGAGEDGIAICKAALARRGLKAELVKAPEGNLYRNSYDCEGAKVSVVILSKDNPSLLENCIAKIRKHTDYPDYEVILVDNGSSQDNKEKYQALSEQYDFAYFHHPMEFNFSALCNFGVQQSTGELILLMNDDVEVIEGSYMRFMAGLAVRKEVGAVGARLRYGDGISIQHVGVTSLGIGPSHQLQKKSDERNRYFGRNRVEYEMIGVTAACLMVRRSVYDEVGGLEEGLKVAYNDVDFCMKIVEAGYINVQCNGAVLLHHESLTRGFDGDSDEKWNRLLAEKERLYSRHPQFKAYDPYHSESLIDNSSEYICSLKTPAQDFDWRSEVIDLSGDAVGKGTENPAVAEGQASQIMSESLPSKKDFSFRLTMDHAVLQRRFNPEDEDFFWIDGWVYVPGADQTLISKRIILENCESHEQYAVTTKDVYRPDVENMLSAARNIAMAGFLARISPAVLSEGSYRVAILLESGERKSLEWTNEIIRV